MQVVDVDNVRQRVTVKLIPRIDLQALANKLVIRTPFSLRFSLSNWCNCVSVFNSYERNFLNLFIYIYFLSEPLYIFSLTS